MSTTRKLDALFYDKGGAVFNVMHSDFGAKGDGVTDDTAAIQAAIDAAESAFTGIANREGATVWLPAGEYGVSSDIDLPMGVSLVGAGSRSTRIKWIGALGGTTNAVVTSNIGGSAVIHGVKIHGVRIECAGEDVGLRAEAWNENCGWDDFEVAQPGDIGVKLDSVSGAGALVSQNTEFGRLRVIPKSGATAGLWLRDCRRLVFGYITVDQPSGASAPVDYAIKLDDGVEQCVFIGVHGEDCTTVLDVGANGACEGNVFVSVDAQSPHATPASRGPFAGVSGTMAVVMHSGVDQYTIISLRESYGYDYLLVDDQKDKTIAGGGGGTKIQQWVNASNEGSFATFETDTESNIPRRPRGGTATDGDTTPSVAGMDRLTLTNTNATSVTFLDGGQSYQRVLLHATNGNTTLVHSSTFVLKGAVNRAMAANDVVEMVRIAGSTWLQVDTPETANNGTATLANGNTSIVVTHSLGVTPDIHDIQATPIEAWGNATQFWISTPTSTQFTINVDQDPGQDVDFAWRAGIE